MRTFEKLESGEVLVTVSDKQKYTIEKLKQVHKSLVSTSAHYNEQIKQGETEVERAKEMIKNLTEALKRNEADLTDFCTNIRKLGLVEVFEKETEKETIYTSPTNI